ncbi:MAG: MBL fold metallo-hydrolase [Gemmatimonadales bacterium]|nr:MAG: MBL fold metallo-hydrolase [Gemmatimonadales bacterium]
MQKTADDKGTGMNRNPLLDSDGTATGLKPSFVKTLGTVAADHEWNRLVEPGVRGSACTLIDGHILVDFGITGLANLARAGISVMAVTDMIITHSHGDHLDGGGICRLVDMRRFQAHRYELSCGGA